MTDAELALSMFQRDCLRFIERVRQAAESDEDFEYHLLDAVAKLEQLVEEAQMAIANPKATGEGEEA
jgi:hypothetical protein